jgi:hypothetical protein
MSYCIITVTGKNILCYVYFCNIVDHNSYSKYTVVSKLQMNPCIVTKLLLVQKY